MSPSGDIDPWKKGYMHARARPVVMGTGLSAYRYAGSNVMVFSVKPDQNFVKNDTWQYSRR